MQSIPTFSKSPVLAETRMTQLYTNNQHGRDFADLADSIEEPANENHEQAKICFA